MPTINFLLILYWASHENSLQYRMYQFSCKNVMPTINFHRTQNVHRKYQIFYNIECYNSHRIKDAHRIKKHTECNAHHQIFYNTECIDSQKWIVGITFCVHSWFCENRYILYCRKFVHRVKICTQSENLYTECIVENLYTEGNAHYQFSQYASPPINFRRT